MQPLPIVYHPDYVVPLPLGHRFPMAKFSLLYEQLCGQADANFAIHCPPRPNLEAIETVHDPNFVQDYLHGTLDDQAQRRIGLPWSEALVNRTVTAVGGTILTARLALEHGISLNTAGGTHHAFPHFGSGFCIFNDVAIAIRLLQSEGKIQRALILDLDVHQGDGTAYIFAGDSTVITCSIHCDKNFPSRKQVSDIDIPMAEGTQDESYLQTLDQLLAELFQAPNFDLVFYNAGIDPHQDDLLGKMNLSDRGIWERDRKVLAACKHAKIPVAGVIGGGYSKDLQALAHRHSFLFSAALQVYGVTYSPRIQVTQSCN